MNSNHLLLEEPIRMASILEPSKPSFFPAMTKIVGTLGPKSRSVEIISDCLKAGMSDDYVLFSSVARFDFSWGDIEFHQETLENLKTAVKSTRKLCAIMLDTGGPELQVVNKTEHPISLEADTKVILTPDQDKPATSNLLPINYHGLSKHMEGLYYLPSTFPCLLIYHPSLPPGFIMKRKKAVKKGDTIFIGQYLFTGNETTSVWLEVDEVCSEDVVCLIKNSATLSGTLYTLHVSQIRIDMPTLTDKDKEARSFLSKLGELNQTQIFAKIENIEGLTHFDEILQEADGIIFSRGNLGIDLPPE
ncbi:hypothetical protein Goklo_005053, partial [Gossypium klotzschianum]|nr:hypothetical protein [Gossypium klotzschianum]